MSYLNSGKRTMALLLALVMLFSPLGTSAAYAEASDAAAGKEETEIVEVLTPEETVAPTAQPQAESEKASAEETDSGITQSQPEKEFPQTSNEEGTSAPAQPEKDNSTVKQEPSTADADQKASVNENAEDTAADTTQAAEETTEDTAEEATAEEAPGTDTTETYNTEPEQEEKPVETEAEPETSTEPAEENENEVAQELELEVEEETYSVNYDDQLNDFTTGVSINPNPEKDSEGKTDSYTLTLGFKEDQNGSGTEIGTQFANSTLTYVLPQGFVVSPEMVGQTYTTTISCTDGNEYYNVTGNTCSDTRRGTGLPD